MMYSTAERFEMVMQLFESGSINRKRALNLLNVRWLCLNIKHKSSPYSFIDPNLEYCSICKLRKEENVTTT